MPRSIIHAALNAVVGLQHPGARIRECLPLVRRHCKSNAEDIYFAVNGQFAPTKVPEFSMTLSHATLIDL
jgi:hypothetical protein